jgi:hypothetical protein
MNPKALSTRIEANTALILKLYLEIPYALKRSLPTLAGSNIPANGATT